MCPLIGFNATVNVPLARISSNIKGIELFKRKEHDGRPLARSERLQRP